MLITLSHRLDDLNPVFLLALYRKVKNGPLFLTLTSTHTLMFFVPMFLLALNRAVGGVPTTVVHCLFFTIVTLNTGIMINVLNICEKKRCA